MSNLTKYFIKAAKIAAKNRDSGRELVHIDEDAMTVTNGRVVFRFPHKLNVSGAGYLNFVKVKNLITKFKGVDTLVFDGGNATFTSGKRTVKFGVENVADPAIFSVYSQYNKDTLIHLSTATNQIDFGADWVIAQGFVSKNDDFRPSTTGVFIDESNIAATDHNRLCRLPHANKIEKALVYPPEVFNLLNGNTTVRFFLIDEDSEFALADNGVEQVRFVPISDMYPPYNTVWPAIATSVVRFNTQEVLNAIDSCSVVDHRSKWMEIHPSVIRSENLDEGIEASYDITQTLVHGEEPITIAVNALLLQHILKLCGEEATVKFNGHNRALVINELYLLMPFEW